MSSAEVFVKMFNPFRSRYAYQGHSPLLDEPWWSTQNQYLKTPMIENAILGQLVIGFFLTTTTTVLGVDIDDHQRRGDGYLLAVYERVVRALRSYPSIAVKSPRGFHAFWILSERLPWIVLNDVARERLKGIPIEIKPTPEQALRIPAESHLIDPENMQLLNIPFEAVAPAMRLHHPSEMFSTDYVPDAVRESLQKKRSNLRLVHAIPRLEQVEKGALPFQNGGTNEAFLQLCCAYRCAGLDTDQAFYRFILCLAQSPGYTGDLRNQRRLLRRIESEYRSNPYQPKAAPIQYDLFDVSFAEDLAARSPFSVQRQKPIELFILRILRWKHLHDEILKDNGQTAFWDYLYPFYRKNRSEGYYPLAAKFLRTANKRYEQLLPWLIDVKFIEPAPYRYSPKVGICKYYRISEDEGCC